MANVLGIDEAGRGPLAGPVVAAGVVLDENNPIGSLNDSKKLSKKARESLYEEIMARSKFVAVKVIDSQIIDKINILQATLLAMKGVIDEAKKTLPIESILIDGNQLVPGVEGQKAIVNGDSLIEAIMAASIVAKVHRDSLMKDYHHQYPQYGFLHHQGYGTRAHMEALSLMGPCPIHRRSFSPLKVTHD
jgi:ribonuclease HII